MGEFIEIGKMWAEFVSQDPGRAGAVKQEQGESLS